MAIARTREEFKNACLRNLGYPVVQINIDDDQIEDKIDEALLYYRDYHFDGSERLFYRHEVTSADIANKYITMPETTIGIHSILDIHSSTSGSSANMFDFRYQIHLTEMFNIAQSSYLSYYMAMTHLNSIDEMFTGKNPFRYNRHGNRLYIDMNWSSTISPGQYIVVDGYFAMDPDVYSDVWGDRWLKKYATALIQKQWGMNLSKFQGIQLPGGMTFDGQSILDRAQTEIDKLEEEMLTSYSLPVTDMIG